MHLSPSKNRGQAKSVVASSSRSHVRNQARTDATSATVADSVCVTLLRRTRWRRGKIQTIGSANCAGHDDPLPARRLRVFGGPTPKPSNMRVDDGLPVTEEIVVLDAASARLTELLLGGNALGDERIGSRRGSLFLDLGQQPGLDGGGCPLLFPIVMGETAGLENYRA